jgi:hypothetical protein
MGRVSPFLHELAIDPYVVAENDNVLRHDSAAESCSRRNPTERREDCTIELKGCHLNGNLPVFILSVRLLLSFPFALPFL